MWLVKAEGGIVFQVQHWPQSPVIDHELRSIFSFNGSEAQYSGEMHLCAMLYDERIGNFIENAGESDLAGFERMRKVYRVYKLAGTCLNSVVVLQNDTLTSLQHLCLCATHR